jgi:hypothetical protein
VCCVSGGRRCAVKSLLLRRVNTQLLWFAAQLVIVFHDVCPLYWTTFYYYAITGAVALQLVLVVLIVEAAGLTSFVSWGSNHFWVFA